MDASTRKFSLTRKDRCSPKQRRFWLVLAAALIAAGTSYSLYAYGAVRGSVEKSQKAFATSSGEIAATLTLAIQHEQDLIISTQSFVIGNPDPTQAEFTQWSKSVNALQRYPELLGLAIIKYVPAAQLSTYAKKASTTQSTPFTVTPAGTRPFYCFASIGILRAGAASIPADQDLCVGAVGKDVLAARASGKSAALPIVLSGVKSLGLETPVYSSASVPTTLAARESAFMEAIGVTVRPNVLLRTALQNHPNTAVAFRFGTGTSAVTFRSGQVPVGPETMTVNLHNGWTVETLGVDDHGGLFGDAGGLPLLLGGIALTLLLALALYMLGMGRARSKALADEQTDELRFQAMHDSLTGLPNRALIMDRIDQLLARGRRSGTLGAALYIDLDDFKNVNDSLGHEAGDRLLASVAVRMASTLREADTIGRMGGDEFVVLLDGGHPMVAPELVAERLLDVMRQPFELEGAFTLLQVNTSIGIAVGDRATAGELLRDADIALYEAKANGKNRYEFFHPDMHTDIGNRIRLEFDLRSALAAEQFRLVYQPIYNLETLDIVSVEALIRWEHPVDGQIQPDDFIPILEQTGQIREVGAWVLRQACKQAAAWHAQGDTLNMSVNISGRQLDDDKIIEHIRDALQKSGLDATSLIVEVTETALMRDTGAAVKRLQAIKDLGVSISVDDFGTGYSSLAYLQQFPVDCIKIDRSFTSAMASSPESKALVRTFVQLGRDLGLKTLAEGVETEVELDLLRADQVDEVQGYHFARPLDPEILEALLLAPRRLTNHTIAPEKA